MLVCMDMMERTIERRDVPVPVADPFVQLAFVHDAIDDLAIADLGVLDREWFARYARSVDELAARIDALGIEVEAEAPGAATTSGSAAAVFLAAAPAPVVGGALCRR
jgi:hypothetical protein